MGKILSIIGRGLCSILYGCTACYFNIVGYANIIRTLELISLITYLGGYIIKLLLRKPTNHLACYGVYLMTFIALRQEKLYISQSPDPPYYTVRACGNPIYCLT